MKSFLSRLVFAIACGATPDVGQPPPAPGPADGIVSVSGDTATFAIDQLFLGESSQSSGEPTSEAWRSFGFNLDHRVSDANSGDVCTLTSGAPKTNQADGELGIDNAWGATILPMLQTGLSLPTPSVTLGAALGKGATTLELEVSGLPGDRSASANGLGLRAFVAAPVASQAFGEDVPRPVVASSVVDGETIASGAVATFATVYVNRGTLVATASAGPLTIDLPFSLELQIHDAVVTFDRTSDDQIEGMIAGVLDPDAFIPSAEALAASRDASVCADPSKFDVVAALIRQGRDIMMDGTNASGVPCDGISIGLGFHAMRVANPSEVVPDPKPTPCD